MHNATTSGRPGFHHVEHVMGTAVTFDGRDNQPGHDGLAEAVAWLHHVDQTFSTYIHDSPISRLGRAEITLDAVDDEITDVLLQCERLRDETNGAFDAFAVPAPNGTTLDPSGLVKGWSIERAAQILAAHGHPDFTINAGGDIAIRGHAAPGAPWTVGIRHPEQRDQLAMVLHIVGPAAVATSATYERGAHIIDPRTAQPTTELASVTVVGVDLATVDAYATAVFVMGLTGLDLLSQREGFEAMAITHDSRVVCTFGFDGLRNGSMVSNRR
jgi:thiamine biosynthesis lipoprotein